MNCTKPVERMNFPPFTMSICNIYKQQTIYIRYHSLNVCVYVLLPLDVLSTYIHSP